MQTPSRFCLAALLTLSWSCSPGTDAPSNTSEGEGEAGEGEGEAGEGEGEGEGEAGEGEGEGEAGEGEGEGEGEANPIDCNNLPDFSLDDAAIVQGAAGYHGLGMALGGIVGVTLDGTLVVATRAGQVTPLLSLSNRDAVEQIETTPDGRVLLVLDDQLLAFSDTSGSYEVVAEGVGAPYGLTMGPDGQLYLTSYDTVDRVNLSTGAIQNVLTRAEGVPGFHDVDFNLNSTLMYIASIEEKVIAFHLDSALRPVGDFETLLQIDYGWFDAVEVDSCGNLWIPEFSAGALHRLNPVTGEDTVAYGLEEQYPHGLVFGTGANGFENTSIFAPLPYREDAVAEYAVGVRAGRTVRTLP